MVVSKTAVLSAGSMNEIGVLSWLLPTFTSLLTVRLNQKKLLKTEFDKYQDTAANLTLIDTILDYLYWDEKYINKQLQNVENIIMDNKNELTLLNYIDNEYGSMVSMGMFMKGFIDLHMRLNRVIVNPHFGEFKLGSIPN